MIHGYFILKLKTRGKIINEEYALTKHGEINTQEKICKLESNRLEINIMRRCSRDKTIKHLL